MYIVKITKIVLPGYPVYQYHSLVHPCQLHLVSRGILSTKQSTVYTLLSKS